MTLELIPVSDERLLLERMRGLEWSIDRLHRDLAACEKERTEILDHCLRNEIFEAEGFRLVKRQGVPGRGQDAWRVERVSAE